MSERTGISWTDHTFNPWWGCSKVSSGCKNCYAEVLAKRWGHNLWEPKGARKFFGAKHWREPVQWNEMARAEKRTHKVFCGSMCDWAEDHPALSEHRAQLWALIRQTPCLAWQLLTKRPERIPELLPADWGAGYPNVWLGTTIESNKEVYRAELLRKRPARTRFISYEPALGPLTELNLVGIDWVIYGGESGPGYRDHRLEWARDMRDRCQAAGVAFFFKQSPGIRTGMGTLLDGREIKEFPI